MKILYMDVNILNLLNTPLFDLLKNQNKDIRLEYMINEIFPDYDILCLRGIYGTGPLNRKNYLITQLEKIGFTRCLRDTGYMSDNGMILLSKLEFNASDISNGFYIKVGNAHIFMITKYNLVHIQSKVNIKNLYVIYDPEILKDIKSDTPKNIMFNKGAFLEDDYEYELHELKYKYECSNVIRFPEIDNYGIVTIFKDV